MDVELGSLGFLGFYGIGFRVHVFGVTCLQLIGLGAYSLAFWDPWP